MIKLDFKPFAKDEFFTGKYNNSTFTITNLLDFNSGISEQQILWVDSIPINKEEAEHQIIKHFNDNKQ